MGCCLGALLLAGAPRLALVLWWFWDPVRVTSPFAGWSSIGGLGIPAWGWVFVGLLLLPWLTIAFVFVAPGGIAGLDWLILLVALLLDLGAHGGGGRAYSRRRLTD